MHQSRVNIMVNAKLQVRWRRTVPVKQVARPLRIMYVEAMEKPIRITVSTSWTFVRHVQTLVYYIAVRVMVSTVRGSFIANCLHCVLLLN